MKIENPINYEILFKDTDEKIRCLLHLEKWIRRLKDEGSVDSFHVKHHREFTRVRLRLSPAGPKHGDLVADLQNHLREFGGEGIIERSHEELNEDLSVLDPVKWKILEYNTEILFLLLNSHGLEYKKFVREKYWAGKFDMIHLLLNQLGLPEPYNWQELAKLEVNSRHGLEQHGIKFEFAGDRFLPVQQSVSR